MNDDRLYRRGLAASIGSALLFAVMAVLLKAVQAHGIDIYKVTLFRFAIGAVLIASLGLGGFIRLEFRNHRMLLVRGLLGGVAVFLYFLSIYEIGLAKGTVISSSSPVFATIGGILWLGEKSSRRKWLLVAAAFAGIVLIAMGGGGSLAGFGGWEMLAVAGAITSGAAYVSIKQLSATDSPFAIFLAQCAMGFWLLLLPANLQPCAIGWSGGLLLLGVGLVAAIAQLLMTAGYRHLSVATASQLSLITTVANVIVGVVWFREPVTVTAIAGMAMVLAACALIVMDDRSTGKPGCT
ncbi:MAG: DMT family transporter [Planctomycetota bacterium]